MSIKKETFLLTLALLITTISFSQKSDSNRGERPTTDQVFEQMDANKDGKLSESEVKGPLKKGFSTIDSNSDGFITKEELENAPKPERKERN